MYHNSILLALHTLLWGVGRTYVCIDIFIELMIRYYIFGGENIWLDINLTT